MTERSRFFDSVDGDRVYTSDSWAQIFELFVSDGYVVDEENELVVTETSPQSMGVEVDTGAAWVQGRSYENLNMKTLPIAANSSGSARVDRVVVRLDYNARTVETVVKQGTPGAGAPALQRDTDVWELSLAQVAVANGAALITDAQITDERDDPTLAGVAQAPEITSRFRTVADSTERDALPDQFDGMTIYREDTDDLEVRRAGVWQSFSNILAGNQPKEETAPLPAALRNKITMPFSATSPHIIWSDHDNQLYVFGGVDYSGASGSAVSMTSMRRYNPVTNTWSAALASLPIGRNGSTAIQVGNKILHIGGGNTNQVYGLSGTNGMSIYDIDTNTWSQALAHASEPGWFVGAVKYNGKAIIFGGAYYNGTYFPVNLDCKEFNPATNTWTTLANLTPIDVVNSNQEKYKALQIVGAGMGDGGVLHALSEYWAQSTSVGYPKKRILHKYDRAANTWNWWYSIAATEGDDSTPGNVDFPAVSRPVQVVPHPHLPLSYMLHQSSFETYNGSTVVRTWWIHEVNLVDGKIRKITHLSPDTVTGATNAANNFPSIGLDKYGRLYVQIGGSSIAGTWQNRQEIGIINLGILPTSTKRRLLIDHFYDGIIVPAGVESPVSDMNRVSSTYITTGGDAPKVLTQEISN